tara:strand:- start:2791 stop:2964 length:174 start_codon:yes stop_codon:yes gene_type:complete
MFPTKERSLFTLSSILRDDNDEEVEAEAEEVPVRFGGERDGEEEGGAVREAPDWGVP